MGYHNYNQKFNMYIKCHKAKPLGMAVPRGFFRLAVFRISV